MTANTPVAIRGNCLDILPQLPDASLDMILVDLPYNITRNKWDTLIPLEDYIQVSDKLLPMSTFQEYLWNPRRRHSAKNDLELRKLLNLPLREITQYWQEHKQSGLWTHYKRLIKLHGVILLFGSGMFTAELMRTGKDLWRYNLIWEKTTPTGFLNAGKMPLRTHEVISVFYRYLPVYHPQMSTGHIRKVSTAAHKRNSKQTTNYGEYTPTTYDSTERYPNSVWHFATDKQKCALHPTQKPLALCEELIKTYSDEGALVLDHCAGSFTTAVACDNLNRRWIAVEKDPSYFEAGLNRVNENRLRLGLPPVAPNYYRKEGTEHA